MPTNFEAFERLAPELRIVELNKLIKMLKKQIEEREQAIQTAEEMLKLAVQDERVLEEAAQKVQTVPAKGIEKKTEEKIELPRKKDAPLEQLLSSAPRTEETIKELAQRPITDLYKNLKDIYESQQKTGVETREQRDQIYAIKKGIYEKEKDVERGKYSPGEKKRHLMSTAEQLAENMYQQASGSYKQ